MAIENGNQFANVDSTFLFYWHDFGFGDNAQNSICYKIL